MNQTDSIFDRPVMLTDAEGWKRVDLSEFVCFIADGMYCHGYKSDKNRVPFTFTCTLKSLEEQLPNNIFFRIHRSAIINIWHVKCIFERKVVLSNDMSFTVAKQYYVDFKKLFIVIGQNK